MPSRASSSISASSARCATLYWFCTQTIARSGVLGDLRGRDVAQPDVADQALALQLGEHGERRLDRALGGAVDAEHAAQVDHLEHVEAEVAQVVVHRLGQLGGREGRQPGAVLAAPGADLGDDDEVVGIGMQRLADDLVGDVRAVEIAGVDVVDAAAPPPRAAPPPLRRDPWVGRTRRVPRAAWRRSRAAAPCGRRG